MKTKSKPAKAGLSWLSLEDSEMKRNIYPNDREHAELLYQRFKTEAPKAENDAPFVAAFIKSIERDKT